jgi:hypothetical protein
MSVTESRVDAEVGAAGIDDIATDVGPGDIDTDDIDTAGVADPGCVAVQATATGASSTAGNASSPARQGAERGRKGNTMKRNVGDRSDITGQLSTIEPPRRMLSTFMHRT